MGPGQPGGLDCRSLDGTGVDNSYRVAIAVLGEAPHAEGKGDRPGPLTLDPGDLEPSQGQGVADVLFGDHQPTGTLPVTWMRRTDQQPINEGDGKPPLFPLGYGLRYGAPGDARASDGAPSAQPSAAVAAGASAAFGFNGSTSGRVRRPEAFNLNGVDCGTG